MFTTLILIFYLLAIPGAWSAEDADLVGKDSAASQTAPAPLSGSTAVGKSRLIQPGDRLRVKIYPEDEFIKSTETEVSSEGSISLPLIGKVKVVGMKNVDAEREIVSILTQDYLVNPVVIVEVVESLSGREKRSVAILGQVQKPGTYEIPPDRKLTLLGVISTAGGFTDIANVKKIKIIRKQEGGKTQVLRANAESIISGKQTDIELEPGDVIHVGESFF